MCIKRTILVSVLALSSFLNASADAKKQKETTAPASVAEKNVSQMKYFLMIGTPNDAAWKAVIEAEADMAEPARKSIEAMGGKLISYWIAVGEAKNYGIVAFPDSKQIAKIVYMRTMQGVMKDIQFVEIMPTGEAAGFFKELIKGDKNLEMPK